MNYHSFLFIIACLLQVSSSLSKFFKIIYTDYFCHIMLEKVLHILYNSQNDKSLFTFSCTKPTKDYKTTTNRWIVISSEDKSGWKRQTIHYWMWSRWRASTWVNNNLIKSRIPHFDKSIPTLQNIWSVLLEHLIKHQLLISEAFNVNCSSSKR